MTIGALLFMLITWTCVLGLTGWCYWKLMQTPADEPLPPPGTSL